MTYKDDSYIEDIENLIFFMKSKELNTDRIEYFFEVGEWLLAFEGIEFEFEKDRQLFSAHENTINTLTQFFRSSE